MIILLVCCMLSNYYRDIYERAIHLKLSTKKMKFMFKRYLEFEQKYGGGADVEAVKLKARAYVEARTGDA